MPATVACVNLADIDHELTRLLGMKRAITAFPTQHSGAELERITSRVDELLDLRLAIR